MCRYYFVEWVYELEYHIREFLKTEIETDVVALHLERVKLLISSEVHVKTNYHMFPRLTEFSSHPTEKFVLLSNNLLQKHSAY